MSVSSLRLYTDIHRGEYEGFAKGWIFSGNVKLKKMGNISLDELRKCKLNLL